jgi:hypothetical protein
MTTVTLATIESHPFRRALPDARWRIADLSAPTTVRADRSLEAIERANAVLVLARVLVLSLLGTGAMVAGALIGRL